jgi:2-C-methyl-D-erythritol 4-phosphate cytidylyltransferase
MINKLIIVAGGSGNRMNNSLPKQFIKINNKEIILHTIERFKEFDPSISIIIAVHKNHLATLQKLIDVNKLNNIQICEGGESRFQSVKNALTQLSDNEGFVGIHDAARPLVSITTNKNCFHSATIHSCAIPAINVEQSIRFVDNENSKAVNRNHYNIIQTPQCFSISKIKKAFEVNYSESFTDDATVFEAAGEKIFLVEGNPENIKITHPLDLIIAKSLLDAEQR